MYYIAHFTILCMTLYLHDYSASKWAGGTQMINEAGPAYSTALGAFIVKFNNGI